jgi:hypothetical protein
MNHWIANLQAVLQLALGHPGSNIEMWILVIGAFAMMWGIVGKAGNLLGIDNTQPALTFTVTLVGTLLSLLALAAARMYLPAWSNPQFHWWILIGVPVAVGFLLVAPLMGLLQKAGYFAAVMSWALSVASAALVILLIGTLFDSFMSGSHSAGRGNAHKKQIEQMIQQ